MIIDADAVKVIQAGFNPRGEILSLIKQYASDLKMPEGGDPKAFLWALCGIETSYGEQAVCKVEYAYGPGGLYYQKNEGLKFQYAKYGSLASNSYGPWQIMFIRAVELGYNGHPLCLWDGAISLPLVIKHLNGGFSKGASTIQLLAACYNGGYGAIKNQNDAVKSYVAKWTKLYENSKGTLI